jgi:hypothetical protein
MLKVLVQAHSGTALAQDARQRRLAHLDRFSAQVCAVQLQQVEGIQEGLGLVPAVTEHVEGRRALFVAAHHLAIDQAGPGREM